MFDFKIKGNPAWLRNVARDVKSDYQRAGARALNRTADGARSVAQKSIAADLAIKQKAVGDALKIRRATPAKLEAAVVATGRRIPLSGFGARQTKKGVSYAIGPIRKLLASAFMAKMKSGHLGVFKRRGKARLKIDERYGPSIEHVFVKRKIMEAMRAVVEERLEREMQHQLEFYAKRVK